MSAPEVMLTKIFCYRADPIDTVQVSEVVFRSSAIITYLLHGAESFLRS